MISDKISSEYKDNLMGKIKDYHQEKTTADIINILEQLDFVF
jgi:hypothetical protein